MVTLLQFLAFVFAFSVIMTFGLVIMWIVGTVTYWYMERNDKTLLDILKHQFANIKQMRIK